MFSLPQVVGAPARDEHTRNEWRHWWGAHPMAHPCTRATRQHCSLLPPPSACHPHVTYSFTFIDSLLSAPGCVVPTGKCCGASSGHRAGAWQRHRCRRRGGAAAASCQIQIAAGDHRSIGAGQVRACIACVHLRRCCSQLLPHQEPPPPPPSQPPEPPPAPPSQRGIMRRLRLFSNP